MMGVLGRLLEERVGIVAVVGVGDLDRRSFGVGDRRMVVVDLVEGWECRIVGELEVELGFRMVAVENCRIEEAGIGVVGFGRKCHGLVAGVEVGCSWV